MNKFVQVSIDCNMREIMEKTTLENAVKRTAGKKE